MVSLMRNLQALWVDHPRRLGKCLEHRWRGRPKGCSSDALQKKKPRPRRRRQVSQLVSVLMPFPSGIP
jgi:hypothetical protein